MLAVLALEELPRPCPPRQLGRGPRRAASGSGRSEARGTRIAGGPPGEALAPGPARPGRCCRACGGPVDREDVGALRLDGSWWHRACWLAGAAGREGALRSAREAVGRRLAVADYLLAQQEWGGLPGIVSGPILVPFLVEDGVDNHG